MNAEDQYNMIKNCYLVCKGKDVSCDMYSKPKNYCRCYIYKSLLNDKLKLDQGKSNITFPVLERILKEQMSNLDAQSENILQTKWTSQKIEQYKKVQDILKD